MTVLVFGLGLVACSSSDGAPEVGGAPALDAGAPSPDGGALGDGGDPADPDAGGDGGGSDPSPGDAGPPPDACTGFSCGDGQRCEVQANAAVCVDNTCADLSCAETQRCDPAPGGGNQCVDAACSDDLQCGGDEYCDGSACQPDECEALTRVCSDDTVLGCASNGSGESMMFTCESAGYFESSCQESVAGEAACSCEGDWDCPAFTVCELGVCVGTGTEPSCTLPPVDFSDVPPELELHWGADTPGGTAHGGTPTSPEPPWNTFTHVLSTPVVANLDDDNGDGLVNEADFPEILFISHKGDNPWRNGVLRAVHGGGPNKGSDYFSRCGDTLWSAAAPMDLPCANGTPDADSGAPPVVADLDYDGFPEVIYTRENNTFRILDNTGVELFTLGTAWPVDEDGATIAVANLDHSGLAEIIVGRYVYVLGVDDADQLLVTHILSGDESLGRNDNVGFMACPADLVSARPGLEIAVGSTLYGLPALDACDTPPCSQALEVIWHAPDIGDQGTDLAGHEDGYCAVADVWGSDFESPPGPDNPPDGEPEVVLIADGSLVILGGATGTLIDIRALGGQRGGAPNVDDFDGDGFMEIATAMQAFYRVVDLQAPGASCPAWDTSLPEDNDGANPNLPANERVAGGLDAAGNCVSSADCNDGAACLAGFCQCLHNGWQRESDDDSSRATSSSVFDFNGDGSAEVVYNDECELRVYDGVSGEVLYSATSRSRTAIENPVVADVDNDGNAEIVVGSNNAVNGRCDEDGATPTGVNGMRVFGDSTDTWVSARRIWNQQSYHVTNVTEAGGIPLHEPESWRVLNGRTYNTYRSQPRSAGVAPDLSVVGVTVSASGGGCDLVATGGATITFKVENLGDLRVGPGIDVTLHGVWTAEGVDEELFGDAAQTTPLVVTLTNSLEPGASVILSVEYDAANNDRGRLPDEVRVVVDEAGRERECNEDNNALQVVTDTQAPRPDLRLELNSVADCPDPTVEGTLFNDGSVAVSDVLVVFYAGDPSQGGSALDQVVIAGPLEPGESTPVSAVLGSFPPGREVVVYGIADPNEAIEDCARGNNQSNLDDPFLCPILIQ